MQHLGFAYPSEVSFPAAEPHLNAARPCRVSQTLTAGCGNPSKIRASDGLKSSEPFGLVFVAVVRIMIPVIKIDASFIHPFNSIRGYFTIDVDA